MIVTTLQALEFDVQIYSTEQQFLWERRVFPCTGVTSMDALVDVRNVQAPVGAGLALIPSFQYCARRADRPDDGTLFAGTAAIAPGLYKFRESLSNGTKTLMRRGIAFKLTSGTFARAQGTLYTSYRNVGMVLGAEEFHIQPNNTGSDVSIHRIGDGTPIPTTALDAVKLTIHGMGNLSNTMRYRPYARVFNDPLQRGGWTAIGTAASPAAGDFDDNTGEISLGASFTLANFMWIEFALGVWKNAGTDPNSRCVIHVLPSLRMA